jgi:muramoyltetrapeptide carboxypeptidase
MSGGYKENAIRTKAEMASLQMTRKTLRIGIVAPASRIDQALAEQVTALAASLYGERAQLHFHPQCFLSSGHFAGPDADRADAFVEVANSPSINAVWIARGGYGSCRLLEQVMPRLTREAMNKTYLGYSDAGALLAALYAKRFRSVVHGPMPADLKREGGIKAVTRALRFLIEGANDTYEPHAIATGPSVAFNMTILSQLLGTPYEPDLSGHTLMLEEIDEHLYRIDRTFFHITSNPRIRKVGGIRLGRCSQIPSNQVDFGEDEVAIAQRWCAQAGIRYLGRADIGHDVDNKIVPFGSFAVV